MQCPTPGDASDTDKGDQLQRLLDQSAYWQQQLNGTPGLLTPFTPASPQMGTTRQQQLQQLRQRLTPAESR